MSPDSSRLAYDVIAYPTRAQAQIHPERLAAVALLHGLRPTPVAEARVLELGCGDGENLLAIAAAFPRSRCTGIDLSPAAIERGCTLARRCGLTNLELRAGDVRDEGLLAGEFDYVVCHGLYAWVPEDARAGILRQCRDHLAPDGLALVSYNALPGSGVRQEIRHMLRWHVRTLTNPAERLEEAAALARFLAESVPDTDEVRRGFRSELRVAMDKEPGFLFHDELADHYAPLYFSDFMAAATEFGLRFVGDSDPAELGLQALTEETRRILFALAEDRLERQQYLDFILARRFRHTVLCRRHHDVADSVRPDLVQLCLFSSLAATTTPELVRQPGAVAIFARPDGVKLETDFLPGKLALSHLIERAPLRIPFPELAEAVRAELGRIGAPEAWTLETPAALVRFMIEACTPRIAELHSATPEIGFPPGDRPVAFPLARCQATDGSRVTSVFHQNVRLEDRWGREILRRADGTRTRLEILAELDALAATAEAAEAALWHSVRQNFSAAFDRLARTGLFIR